MRGLSASQGSDCRLVGGRFRRRLGVSAKRRRDPLGGAGDGRSDRAVRRRSRCRRGWQGRFRRRGSRPVACCRRSDSIANASIARATSWRRHTPCGAGCEPLGLLLAVQTYYALVVKVLVLQVLASARGQTVRRRTACYSTSRDPWLECIRKPQPDGPFAALECGSEGPLSWYAHVDSAPLDGFLRELTQTLEQLRSSARARRGRRGR